MSYTDRKCIRLCLDGHPKAFRLLVARYEGPLLCCLVRRLRDKKAAEEAGQETFARAYFNLRKLRKPERFASSLFGIADRVVKERRGQLPQNRRIANSLVLKCFPVRLTAIRTSGT